MDKIKNLQYFKVVISATLMIGASMGLCFYASGVFYEPLAQGLNISLGQASMMTMFMLIFMALTALFTPSLLKRFRFHDVLLVGTALCAGSVIAISFCFNRFWVYTFASLMGCGAALIGPVPATTWINNWFEKRKFWTTAVVLAGSALFAALFSPVMSAVTLALGWRMGFVIQSILVLVLMMPALLLKMPLSPQSAGAAPFGVEEEPAPARKMVAMPILCCFIAMAMLSAMLIALPMHYSSLATSIGQSALTGAQMLSFAMIGNLVFKLIGGWLSDKLKAVLSLGILDLLVVIATAGILIGVSTRSDVTLKVMAFLFGSAFALNELSMPLLVSTTFPKRRYANVYAVLNFLSTLTTAIAIPLIGFFYDAVQTYVWIYAIALGIEAILLVIVWYLVHDQKADEFVDSKPAHSLITKLRTFGNGQKNKKNNPEEAEEKPSEEGSEAQPVITVYPKQETEQDVFNRQMELVSQDHQGSVEPAASDDSGSEAADADLSGKDDPSTSEVLSASQVEETAGSEKETSSASDADLAPVDPEDHSDLEAAQEEKTAD